MPSHTNPNTPSSLKPRAAAASKAKRKHRASTASRPRTSQAIRKAAPKSKKKARKLDRQAGYARQRAVEEEFEKREVEMRDVGWQVEGVNEKKKKSNDEGERMDLDMAS